jgi:hypothetical protein
LVLIQQLQATVQQLQAAQGQNAAAPGGAAPPAAVGHQPADPALISLMRLQAAASVPPLTFKGESTGLEARRWLGATVLYLESAGIAADNERLTAIGRLFTGPSASWWQAERARDPADPRKINTWAQFETALRRRYEPVDSGTWARTQMAALVEKGFHSVLAYTDKFNEINAAITDMAEADRVFNYRRGLPLGVQNALATKRLDRLDEATEAALRWEASRAHLAAPTSSSSSNSQNSSGNRVRSNHQASLHQLEEEEFNESQPQPIDRTAALEAQLNRLEGQLKAFSVNRNKPFNRRAGTGKRSEGVTSEMARGRIAAQLCIHCGQSGHFKSNCKNPVDNTTQPPK